jgi:2,3,4,5-tetrahydropyridine-2-carboxylate N-succinyltransferase
MTEALQQTIDEAWEKRDGVGAATTGAVREAVEEAIRRLDSGQARVAEPGADGWRVNQWLKKAVLLSFRLNPMEAISGGPGGSMWWDKVPSKFAGWDEDRFAEAEFRAVPGDRPPRRVHRQGRRADAELRQYRRLCGRRNDDRHLGDGGELRPDRP